MTVEKYHHRDSQEEVVIWPIFLKDNIYIIILHLYFFIILYLCSTNSYEIAYFFGDFFWGSIEAWGWWINAIEYWDLFSLQLR